MTTVTQTASATVFDSVQALYEDMKSNYQSFIRFENELNAIGDWTNFVAQTVYRVVELKRGKLGFYSSKYSDTDLWINGEFVSAEKIGAENDLSEYRITLENRNEPLILLACKKY